MGNANDCIKVLHPNYYYIMQTEFTNRQHLSLSLSLFLRRLTLLYSRSVVY